MAAQKIYAGASLRETRARSGLTQKRFADRLGVSLPYLSQMENNHRPISVGVLLRLAQEFGVDLSTLSPKSGTVLYLKLTLKEGTTQTATDAANGGAVAIQAVIDGTSKSTD